MKFEYSLMNMTHPKERGIIAQESALNKLGREGWELVAIDGEWFIFKRAI
jgi:hypothetical protein